MKRLPIALLVIIGGIMFVILGSANSWTSVQWFGGLITIAGWIWFKIAYADLMREITPIKHYSKRVRKIEREQGDYKQQRAALDSAFCRKMDAINKRHSQNISGKLVRNGKVIYMTEKEETA